MDGVSPIEFHSLEAIRGKLLGRLTSHVADVAFLTLLGGCLLLFANCRGGTAASPPPPIVVEVATVIQRDTPICREWVATLDGYVNADIQPRVAGGTSSSRTTGQERW